MKLFSDCAGRCCICGCAGGMCLAGNGDDDFYPASTEQIIDRLNKNKYSYDTEWMINELSRRGVEYDINNVGSVPHEPSRSISIPIDEDVRELINEVFGNKKGE